MDGSTFLYLAALVLWFFLAKTITFLFGVWLAGQVIQDMLKGGTKHERSGPGREKA